MSTTVPMYGFGGGGGAALNFKVVGNPQPASPSENTIWLNTDVPIASWYFQAEQPKNMAHGHVWFPVGTSSAVEFNALKKNGIQVYPLSAKQMVSGVLVDKTAKSYQGGKWVDWFNGIYLYKNGDQYSDVTGGWSKDNLTWGGGTNNISSLTFNAGNIVVSSDSSKVGVVATKNSIDLSGINTLYMRYTQTGTPNSQTRFGITLAKEIAHGFSGYNMPASKQITAATDSVLEVDVSGVDSGRIFATCDAGNATLTIYEVWGE